MSFKSWPVISIPGVFSSFLALKTKHDYFPFLIYMKPDKPGLTIAIFVVGEPGPNTQAARGGYL